MHTIVYPSHTKVRRPIRRSGSDHGWSSRARVIALILGLVVVAALTATVVTKPSVLRTVSIPAGIRLVAALKGSLSTATAEPGQPVVLETTAPIHLGNEVDLPAGVVVRGEVTEAKGGGRIAGSPELALRFTSLEVEGRSYPIVAEPFRVRGKNDALQSVAAIGGGALVGGVIGAGAGDAAAGVVIGAVAGTGVAVATKGHQIVLGEGQRLRVRLAEPVSVEVVRRPADSEAP